MELRKIESPDTPSAGGGKDVDICSRTSGEGCVGDGEDFKVDKLGNREAVKVRKETGVTWSQEQECMRRRAAEIRKYYSF